MIKYNGSTKLVINSDRHVIKTTSEYKVLPYEMIVQALISKGFTASNYFEQGYYDRSISKGRSSKGLFRMDLVSPIHEMLGVSLSSSNDNQSGLYIHLTVRSVPVVEMTSFRHHESEIVDLDIGDILHTLKGLKQILHGLAIATNTHENTIQSFEILNQYRSKINTNSIPFTEVKSGTKLSLFNNLVDSMINGKGIPEVKPMGNGRSTRPITQVRKRFLLGTKIFQVVNRE